MKKTAPKKSRSRRASIMIMVVALLVLMALLGTAYIATVRTDRRGTSDNADNVQVDLLIEGVLNMCKSAVAGDLFDGQATPRFRPAEPLGGWPAVPTKKLKDSEFYYNFTSTLS